MRRSLFLLAIMMFFSQLGWAQLYKWVDEKGKVHYGDRIPPEYANRGSVELNLKGVPVRKTAPAMTAEQRKAIEDDKERQKLASVKEAEQKRKDEALLAIYMNEQEIEQAKQRNLGTIESVIKGSENRIAELQRRRQDIEAQKPIPAYLQKELTTSESEINILRELVEQKKKEAALLIAKYENDKQRFQEIKGRKAEAQASR